MYNYYTKHFWPLMVRRMYIRHYMTFLSFRVIWSRSVNNFSSFLFTSIIKNKSFWTRISPTSSLGNMRTTMSTDINAGKRAAAYKAVDDWVKVNEEFKKHLIVIINFFRMVIDLE